MSLEAMITTAVTNAPLVAVLAVAYWWSTPRLIRAALTNGSGEVVRRIVREENAAQSVGTAEALTGVRERLAVLETRMSDHMKNCTGGTQERSQLWTAS